MPMPMAWMTYIMLPSDCLQLVAPPFKDVAATHVTAKEARRERRSADGAYQLGTRHVAFA
jgi:hypothetical protein